AALACGASVASAKAHATQASFDMVLLLCSKVKTARSNQRIAGGALDRYAVRTIVQAGAPRSGWKDCGAVSGSATGGMEVPTALESSAQAKHLSHVVLPGVDSCLCPVACARSCMATACWPTTTAQAIRNAKRILRTRLIWEEL